MASTISFSGLASGLDTSSWVEAFVSIKQQKVTALQTDLKSKQTVKNTLNDTRSKFTTLRSAIEKLTDAKFGGAMDLFAKNSATSSDTDIFTATATAGATTVKLTGVTSASGTVKKGDAFIVDGYI